MKFFFLKPPKKKILIFDRQFDNYSFFKLFKKNDCEILDVRYESLNIYVIFAVFLKTGLSNIKKNYLIKYISLVSPKIVVTFIDNNFFFYELKKYYPDAKYIAIQNGRRDKFFFKNLEKVSKKKLFSDYIFVQKNIKKKKISKFIRAKIIVSGSLKNNFTITKNKNKKINSIVFISQIKLGRNIQYTHLGEIYILNLLKKFCKKKKLKLKIFLKGDYYNDYKFRSFIKKNLQVVKKTEILERQKNIIKQLNNYNFFVCMDSTLGYEMFSRKKKVVFFPSINLSKDKLIRFIQFGYPQYLKNTGFFWNNTFQEKKNFKILNNVFKMKKKKWNAFIKDHILNHMAYYPGNKKLKNIINSLL